jgi:hypothetical protein
VEHWSPIHASVARRNTHEFTLRKPQSDRLLDRAVEIGHADAAEAVGWQEGSDAAGRRGMFGRLVPLTLNRASHGLRMPCRNTVSNQHGVRSKNHGKQLAA